MNWLFDKLLIAVVVVSGLLLIRSVGRVCYYFFFEADGRADSWMGDPATVTALKTGVIAGPVFVGTFLYAWHKARGESA